MNLPIQAQPVMRTANTTLTNAGGGVFPSGDGCPTDYWCCTNNTNSWCIDCGGPGFCTVPQTDFCQSYGLHPSDRC